MVLLEIFLWGESQFVGGRRGSCQLSPRIPLCLAYTCLAVTRRRYVRTYFGLWPSWAASILATVIKWPNCSEQRLSWILWSPTNNCRYSSITAEIYWITSHRTVHGTGEVMMWYSELQDRKIPFSLTASSRYWIQLICRTGSGQNATIGWQHIWRYNVGLAIHLPSWCYVHPGQTDGGCIYNQKSIIDAEIMLKNSR